jgi:acyl transferase domain-containing protein/aryl carrier-like protein
VVDRDVGYADSDGIAIVGIAARFPGAENYREFWENLKQVTCSIREIPAQRWTANRYYSPVADDANKSVSKWGGFIDGVDLFDAMFFGISPREAKCMDPQQRIALELAWACIEDAGYAQETLRGSRTGVYLGVMNFDYRERLTEAAGPIAGHVSTGSSAALIPNRISYYFDWRGPSVPVDTACSSSLVALHEAVHALRRGECDQALVGGVSVLCSPTHYVSFSKTGMLSPDGLCRTFDDRANGYVRGEGAGLALLKPLRQAIRDGDRIYGVVRGTAVNHGGKARTVTYPNPLAQADVIASAHEAAGCSPDSIGYIEAHGTGTPKGDPIEISGLKTAFSRLAERFGSDPAPSSCGLGSLKANVGHLEPVAGIAGMIKVLLAMRHRTLPGLAHFQQLNHRIDLSGSPFYIVEHTQDWPARADVDGNPLPRRAGVSSFGFGGVNAHAVLEEFIEPQAPAVSETASDMPALIALSAKSAGRLRCVAQRLLAWLQQAEPQAAALADIAYTLQVGRTAMPHRLALSASSIDELKEKLAGWLAGAAGLDGVFYGEIRGADNPLPAMGPAGSSGEPGHGTGRAGAVLAAWVEGQDVDWRAFHGERPPRRIALPTYPFERESHWLPAPEPDLPSSAAGLADELQYFEERWAEQALVPGTGRRLRTVLCFASSPQTRQAIKDCFAANDKSARVVFIAEASSSLAPDAGEVETVARDDAPGLRKAVERIANRHGSVDAVLYLWPLEDVRHVGDCSPILSLLQAAGACRQVEGPVLLAAQGDGGESRCHWESWLGFERSAGNALANVPVAAVYEIAEPAQAVDLARWAQRLWDELHAASVQSSLSHHGVRHVCRLEPAADPAMATAPAALRRGGTYLITGGLGGLGGLFAERLLRHHAANVVLVGRAPLDDVRRRKLEALERAGPSVMYLQADVGDAARMAACLGVVKERFGVLHGVIHAAGVESWQGLQAIGWNEFENVLAPKVAGTLVLDRVLQNEPIDFLCHFSSSSAIVGDFGGCSYAVANRFQMAHARLRQRRAHGGRTLAINWPLWKSGGMQVGDGQGTAFYLKSTGQRLLEDAEGLAAFEDLLSRPACQTLIMAGERARVRRLLKLDTAAQVVPAAQTAAAAGAPQDAPAAAADTLPLIQRVERDLLSLAGELLQVTADRLTLDGNLADFGFDSINMGALAKVLSSRYGVEVLPPLFFSYPTLERLAHYFTEHHHAAIAAVYAAAGADALAGDECADAIAVIGMSGRFPGAATIGAMWRILAEGRSVLSTPPADRAADWPATGKRCGFAPGVGEFDPLFFDISPREADDMDPRQRLLLEETWKALEDAGYGPAQLAGRCVGTFVGVEEGDYQRLAHRAEGGNPSITANHNGILAGRIAYFLDLSGPALAVNTACSSGLVALHQACQSLRSGECDMAIVAAANLLLTPHGYREMEEAGMLSPDGTCRTFDTRANGMVPAEAAVVLVLKRMAPARADNDRIHALVVASGINSDGRTNGITAPNGVAQARLIESVYRRHRIDPGQIDHVVAHGTGTRLGDPVEVNALVQAFGAFQSAARPGYCALTSNKPNFGHALAASGLLSVVGMVESMRHATIPGSVNWDEPNPFIQWENSPFVVSRESRHWPRSDTRARLGAISAFGMSGTNAHVVLREYVEHARAGAPAPARPRSYLFALSAKNAKALERRIADLADLFEAMERDPARYGGLADIGYTLLERRHHFSHRCAIVAGSAAEAASVLRDAHGTGAGVRHQGKVARDFRPRTEHANAVESLLAQCAAADGDAQGLRAPLAALAELYCQGYVFPWARIVRGQPPRLASLPPYPFLRTRHWIRQADEADATGPVTPVAAPYLPVPAPGAGAADAASDDGRETRLLLPVWDSADAGAGSGFAPRPGSTLLIGGTSAGVRAVLEQDRQALCLPADALAHADALADAVRGRDAFDHVVWCVPPSHAVPSRDDALIAGQELGAISGFRLIRALLVLGYGGRPLNLSVVTVRAQSIGPGDTLHCTHAGVHGLVGALAKERPNWMIRLADLGAPDDVGLPEVLALPPDRRGHAWVYRHGEWYRRHLAPVRVSGHYPTAYRERGVYIVIGGAGDVGDAWSEHLIRQHRARIVWVGRRERDAGVEARLARLAALGAAPLYIAADAGCRESLEAVRATVLARYGEVHGVIHAAMVFANQELAGMTEQQFRSVLRAKVDVSVRVAQVFGRDPLDFLLFFSSMISLIKNPRQAHYATGCVFKDAFARQLARDVSCPVKVVNWGYWGAQKNVDAGEVQLLTELGIGLIQREDGMQALDVLLGSPLNQLGVMRLAQSLEVEGMDDQETIDLYPADCVQATALS